MADSITDNRTLVSNADAATNYVNVAGTAAGTADTDTAIEGSPKTSITFNLTNTIQGLLYNNGSTFSLSGNHVYAWVNVGVAGLLRTKANGGLRFRFCGATITDYFEKFVAGSDTYTGGWRMFVIDVDAVSASPDATGGTPPATTAIQYLGFVGDTNGVMTKKADNFWVDAMWRLPASTPGVLVQGRNGGSTPWTWANILSSSIAGAWGMARESDGGTIILNAPIQFGANDATTHDFQDSNVRIEWDDQPVSATLYGLTVIGGSGSQNFTLGVKSGTGDAATGAQGCIIGAKSTGARWYFDSDDSNIDACGLYGCLFTHGGDFQLDMANVETISTVFLDCTGATVSNSRFQRCSVIDANTADDAYFLQTDDLSDVKFCRFEFSDGHAVRLLASGPSSQASLGNTFSGYGATGGTDAAILNDNGGAVTIGVTGGGSVAEHTYKNGAGSSTTVTGSVTVTVKPIFVGSEVRAYSHSTGAEIDGVENSSGTSQALTLSSGTAVDIVVLSAPTDSRPNDVKAIPIRVENVSFTADQDFVVFQQVDENFVD